VHLTLEKVHQKAVVFYNGVYEVRNQIMCSCFNRKWSRNHNYLKFPSHITFLLIL